MLGAFGGFYFSFANVAFAVSVPVNALSARNFLTANVALSVLGISVNAGLARNGCAAIIALCVFRIIVHVARAYRVSASEERGRK
jgi:hypothetical protein